LSGLNVGSHIGLMSLIVAVVLLCGSPHTKRFFQ
jgi:hypothetical protein